MTKCKKTLDTAERVATAVLFIVNVFIVFVVIIALVG